MAVVSDDAVHLARCGMLRASPIATLDATARQVFVTYCLGSCHGHQCCLWTDGLKNITFSLPLTLKTIFFCDGMKKSDLDDIDKVCSIFNVKTL